MKMLIVSARLIPGAGGRGGAERGRGGGAAAGAADRTSTAPLDQIIGASRRHGERRTLARGPPMGRNYRGLAFYGELRQELSPTTAPISVISNNKWL